MDTHKCTHSIYKYENGMSNDPKSGRKKLNVGALRGMWLGGKGYMSYNVKYLKGTNF